MIENTITTAENLVQVFCGVRGYEKDGVAYLHIIPKNTFYRMNGS